MRRLLLVLFLLFALKGDAATCDWTGVETDSQGCVPFAWFNEGVKFQCKNMPPCFTLQIDEVKDRKEFFSKENPEEKKKVIPILDSSAVALLKNSKLKGIKIVFYNKKVKLSPQFQKEAESYLLDKGVKADQFMIEIK